LNEIVSLIAVPAHRLSEGAQARYGRQHGIPDAI
jgi:hypothetical protein